VFLQIQKNFTKNCLNTTQNQLNPTKRARQLKLQQQEKPLSYIVGQVKSVSPFKQNREGTRLRRRYLASTRTKKRKSVCFLGTKDQLLLEKKNKENYSQKFEI